MEEECIHTNLLLQGPPRRLLQWESSKKAYLESGSRGQDRHGGRLNIKGLVAFYRFTPPLDGPATPRKTVWNKKKLKFLKKLKF